MTQDTNQHPDAVREILARSVTFEIKDQMLRAALREDRITPEQYANGSAAALMGHKS